MVVTSPAPGEEGAKAHHSRGTNPDVPTVCNGDGVPVPIIAPGAMGSIVGKDCLIYHSVSYQLYLGVNMILNSDVRLQRGKSSMLKASLSMQTEALAQENTFSVTGGLQDTAMCLRCIKRKALSLDYLICMTTDNEF